MITLIVKIEAKSDQIDFNKTELMKVVDKTVLEQGCVSYELHQDLENPSTFWLYENWETQEALDAHMKTEHLQNYFQISEGTLEKVEINKVRKI